MTTRGLRWFELKGRKLWYYDNEDDARPIRGMLNGTPKGYIDCVAATVSLFEDNDGDGQVTL